MSDYDVSSITKWRCIVCNEIVITSGGPPAFDFQCPVCGASGDVWEAVTDESDIIIAAPYLGHVLIIGAGIAGVTTAHRILTLAPAATVTLCSAESRRAYNRTAISELLEHAGETVPALPDLNVEGDASFWTHPRLTFLSGKEGTVSNLDMENHTATMESGQIMAFNKLVFATGSQPFTPPTEGLSECYTHRIAFTVRNEHDATDICNQLARAAALRPHQPLRVGLIGGGLLNLEVANYLLASPLAKKPGMSITVFERCSVLLPQSGPEVGGAILTALQRQAEAVGAALEFKLGAEVRAVVAQACDSEAKCTCQSSIVSNVGSAVVEIPVDIVIVGIGVRPHTELAAKVGVSVGQFGIDVDDCLRCQKDGKFLDDVYAVGDCASMLGRRPACNWQEGASQGDRAGALIAGATPAAAPALGRAINFLLDIGDVQSYTSTLRTEFGSAIGGTEAQLKLVRLMPESTRVRAAAVANFGRNMVINSVSVAQPKGLGTPFGAEAVQELQKGEAAKFGRLSRMFEQLMH